MANVSTISGGAGSEGRLWQDKAYGPIAVLGLMTVMFSLVVGIVVGVKAGDLWGPAGAGDAVRRGVIEAAGAWNSALLFFGASLLMTAVVVLLLRIIKTIKVRGGAMQAHLPVLLDHQGGK